MKSVFFKFAVVFLILIISSFSILYIVFNTVVSYINVNSKTANLQKSADAFSKILSVEYDSLEFDGISSMFNDERTDYILDELEYLPSLDEKIINFVVDLEGYVYYLDYSNNLEITNYIDYSEDFYLDEEIINRIVPSDTLIYVGNFNNIFKEQMVTYTSPIYDKDEIVIGAVISCIENSERLTIISAINRLIFPVFAITLVATMIATYFLARHLTKPIRQMNDVVNQFSSGHFDSRIEISGKDEIAQLSESFNKMADTLSELEESRRSFIANVSHDLRTPMTTISGFIQSLREGAIPEDKQDYYLDLISSEIGRLSRLVSSLLDISRLEAGERKFVFDSFDIAEISRQILISFEHKINDKKLDVEFECDEDSMIAIADKDAIYQVLYNLCDNAIKFSYDQGKYKLSVKYDTRDKIVVSVYNEGIGIKPEDQSHLFERFYKSDKSRGLDKTGVGLGLYISKTILDAHYETINVESEYGKWIKFSFTLKQPNKDEIKKINKKSK